MVSSRWIRWSGAAAMLGGALGAVLTPVATSASFLAYGGALPAWALPLRPVLDPLLGFAAPDDVYATYGKAFFPIFLLGLVGLLGLRAAVGDRVGRWGQRGLRLAFAGLAMNLVGNVTDYWLGERILQQPLWGLSFLVFTLLGLLAYLVGAVLLGMATLRAGVLPAWAAGALVAAAPLAVANSVWGMQHVPSAQVLPVALTWLVVGQALQGRHAGCAKTAVTREVVA